MIELSVVIIFLIHSRRIYRVASIAIGGAIGRMHPTPVGVDNNRARLLSATSARSALLPGKRWMGFGSQCASLLGTSSYHQGREKEGPLSHFGCLKGMNVMVNEFPGLQLKNKY